MTRLFALLLFVFACAPAAAQAPRAIWTWEEDSYAMLEHEVEAESAIAFLKSKGVNTIYLYADAYHARNLLASDPQRYRSLIRRLRQHGMRAYALLGSAHLHTERYVLPQRRADALEMVHRVLVYNALSAPEERFDGINLDIEPHLLPNWEQDRVALLRHFLDMSAAIMELKRSWGQSLPIGPAMPFWWDEIAIDWRGKRRMASEHVQDLYDYVALMDYRDRAQGPDGMLAHAAREMAYAARIGRPLVIGVEVTVNEIAKVSFHHLKEADLERELGLLEQAWRRQPAFGGFALHHYRSYRMWLERQAVAPAQAGGHAISAP